MAGPGCSVTKTQPMKRMIHARQPLPPAHDTRHDDRATDGPRERTTHAPLPMPGHDRLGNRGLRHALARARVQARSAVGAARDPAELEADAAAERVLAGTRAVVHAPPPVAGDGDPIARSVTTDGDGRAAAADLALDGPGQPLAARERALLEPAFDQDFANVRIHTGAQADASARALQAHAWTRGDDIVFATGAFAPDTSEGRRLLAHETAHVVQQRGGNHDHTSRASPAPRIQREEDEAAGVSRPDPPGTSREEPAYDIDFNLSGWSEHLSHVPRTEALSHLRHYQRLVRGRIEASEESHGFLRRLHNDQFIVAWISDHLSGSEMPSESIWSRPKALAEEAGTMLARGDVIAAAEGVQQAADSWHAADRQLYDYREGTITGAERAVTSLRVIEVGSAVIFVVASGGAASVGFSASAATVFGGATAAGATTASLTTTALYSAGGAGTFAILQTTAEQTGEISTGTRKHFDVAAIIRQGAISAVTTFVGAMAGGALAPYMQRLFGSYLGNASPQLLAELGEAAGLAGPMPATFFMTRGQLFIADFLAGAAVTPLTTAIGAVLNRISGGSRSLPGPEEFCEMVFSDLVQGGIVQVLLGALTHRTGSVSLEHETVRSPELPSGVSLDAPSVGLAEPPTGSTTGAGPASDLPVVSMSEPPLASEPTFASPATAEPTLASSSSRPSASLPRAPSQPHPDFPNVLVDPALGSVDLPGVLAQLELTPTGSRIVDRIRSGELQIEILATEPEPGAAGIFDPISRLVRVRWSGVNESAGIVVHEGAHSLDPALEPGSGVRATRLSSEAEARAFEYEYRDEAGMPSGGIDHDAYIRAHDQVLRETGDVVLARRAGDRALVESVRSRPEVNRVETPAGEAAFSGDRSVPEAATPLTEPTSPLEHELFGDLYSQQQQRLAEGGISRPETLDEWRMFGDLYNEAVLGEPSASFASTSPDSTPMASSAEGPLRAPASGVPRAAPGSRGRLDPVIDLPGVRRLERMAPDPASPPATATTPEQVGMWNDYCAYFADRIVRLRAEVGTGTVRSNSPIDWRTWQFSHSEGIARGRPFQDRITADLGSVSGPLVESDVGLSRIADPGQGDVVFPDQLIVDPDRSATTVSNKSRDFANYADETAIRSQVEADVRELVNKYAGRLYVRRPSHPLFGRRIQVRNIQLVYDHAVIAGRGLVPAGIELRLALAAGHLAHTLRPDVRFSISFHDPPPVSSTP